MRDLHARMLDAVLAGGGLEGIAELASAEAGGPVAIVLPARGIAAGPPKLAAGLRRYVGEALRGRPSKPPVGIDLEVEVSTGSERLGSVLLLSRDDNGARPLVDREEILRIVALACLTQVAVSDTRESVEQTLRGSLIEDLRDSRIEPDELVRRAARFGCHLEGGAVALVAENHSTRPGHAAALIASDYEGALAELIDGRIYAVLPARGGDDVAAATLAAARGVADRVRSYGPTAVSSFYSDPAELRRAVEEAELVLDVVARDERMAEHLESGIGGGVYRLLFRALASNPEEVMSFYEDTVAPIVRYDAQYRSDLVGTLEAYLANDCSMAATARAIFTHRHTVGYRLDRIRELCGLDPSLTEDRERLGLGLKAYRLIAPTLPR